MIRRTSILLAAAALASVALAGLGCSHAQADDPALVAGRIWLESKPAKPTDYVQGLYLLPRPAFGVFQRASNYDFHFERVDYKRDGGKLELYFPQSDKRESVTFTITACDTLPPFDLCLDLSSNPWGGPKHYFGKRQSDEEDAARVRALAGSAGQR